MPSTKELDAIIAAAKALAPLAAVAEQAGAIKGFEAHLERLKRDCADMERVTDEKAATLALVTAALHAEQTRAADTQAELSARHEETVHNNAGTLAAQRTERDRLQAEIQAAITHQAQRVEDGVQAQTAEARATLAALQNEIKLLTAQREGARRKWQDAKADLEEVRL